MAEAELDLIDVLEAAPVGAIILNDIDHQVLFWNTSVLSILGNLQGDAFAEAACSGFFHDNHEFEAARARLRAGQPVRNLEARIRRDDGREAWATISMRPLRFEGSAATLIWYFDITESKLREHQLERSQDALLEVLDTAPTGAALADGPDRISYWNKALLEILPGTRENPAGAILEGIRKAQTAIDERGQGTTLALPEQDGTERFVAAWRVPIEFEGAPSELTWLHDVTELRRAEQAAQTATVAKSAFLATMSHEIRTPMNGVMAIADLLRETPLDENQARMVDVIQQSGESLVRVLNDILDFSKLEARQLQVETTPFYLDELLEAVVALLTPKAAEKGLTLRLVCRGIDETARLGDPLRLRQVLLNLVGNAVKFTGEGGVSLEVDATDDVAVLRVIDSGIGIPPNRIAHILTPYQQADASTARNYGGTGLGLSISNALLELMGGHLSVDSTPGQGSCFTVTVTLPRDPAGTPRSARLASAPPTRFWKKADQAGAEEHHAVILCVEDNPINRDVLSRVLFRLGFAFEMVADGVQALAALDRSRHGLLMTDGHMPNMDGWELSHRIRQQEARKRVPRLPIIMVTADAVSPSVRRIEESDLDHCLTKPLRRELVEEAILAALPVLASLRVPAEAPPEAASVPASVLDLSGLIDLVGADKADLEALLGDFVTSARDAYGKLTRATGTGDHRAVAAAAHALKGSAGYAGAVAIQRLAAELEREAKAAAQTDTLSGLLAELAPLISTLPTDVQASLDAYFGRRAAAA